MEIPFQLNRKLRSRVSASPDARNDDLKGLALADTKIIENTNGKQIVKTIVVPKRLVNSIVKLQKSAMLDKQPRFLILLVSNLRWFRWLNQNCRRDYCPVKDPDRIC